MISNCDLRTKRIVQLLILTTESALLGPGPGAGRVNIVALTATAGTKHVRYKLGLSTVKHCNPIYPNSEDPIEIQKTVSRYVSQYTVAFLG